MIGLVARTLFFLGPITVLVGSIVAIVLILVSARLVLGLAWKLVAIAAVVLGVLWLLELIGSGTPFTG